MKSTLTTLLIILFSISSIHSQIPKLILPTGHTSILNCFDFDRSNNFILTGSADMTAKLWRISDGKEISSYIGHRGQINFVSFSSYSNKILTASSDGTAKVWDKFSGKLLLNLEHEDEVKQAIFSPNESFILTSSKDGFVKLWNSKNGALIQSIITKFKIKKAFFYKSDSTFILISEQDKGYLYHFSGKIISNRIISYDAYKNLFYKLDTNDGECILFNPDGTSVVINNYEKFKTKEPILFEKLNKLYSETRNCIGQDKLYFNSIDFEQKGKYVLTISSHNKISTWDSRTGVEVKNLEGNLDWINSFYFDEKTQNVLIPNGSKSARLINLVKNSNSINLVEYENWFKSAKFNYDGSMVGISSYDGSLNIFNTISGKKIQVLSAAIKPISSTSAKVFSDTKSILVTTDEGNAKVINFSTGKTKKIFSGTNKNIFSGSVSLSGKLVSTNSMDSTTKIYELTSSIAKQTLFHNSYVYSSSFSKDDKYVCTASFDSVIRIWNINSGICEKSFKVHNGYVYYTLFSPSNRYLASASFDSTAILLDLKSGNVKYQFRGHKASVNNLSFSYDEKFLATASSDSLIKIWDVNSGKLVKTLIDKTDWVEVVRFTPDSKYLVSGSDDGLLKVWEVETGNLIKILNNHHGWIYDIEFSDNGERMITTADDSQIIFYETKNWSKQFTIMQFNDEEWIVFDNKYRYDGTKKAISSLYLSCDDEIIDFEQIKQQLHVPHLLDLLNARITIDSLNYKGIEDLDLCKGLPILTKTNNSNNDTITLTVKERDLKLKEVQIFANNIIQMVVLKDNLKLIKKNIYEYKLPVSDLKLISGKKNEVMIKALTTNKVFSNSIKYFYKPQGKQTEIDKIKIFAVIVGVSDYLGEDNELNKGVTFASSDAQILSETLKKISNQILLNPSDQLKVFLFNESSNSNKSNKPFLKNIRSAIDTISRNANENDIVVFYFAGHGVVSENSFKMLTGECFSSDCHSAITTDMIIKWFDVNNIKAQKRILILDACNSGKLFNEFLLLRGDNPILENSKLLKELETLSEKTGFIGIAAASDGKPAHENKTLSHGLLTYSLLMTLKDKSALIDNNIFVGKWFNQTKQKLFEISSQILDEKQDAQIFSNGDNDLMIGKVTDSILKSIKLVEYKTHKIANPVFIDSITHKDYLSLTNKFKSEFLIKSFEKGIVIDDLSEHLPKLLVKYFIKDDKIYLNAKIYHDNKYLQISEDYGPIDKIDNCLNAICQKLEQFVLSNDF